jgi:Haemolymph juvenile hormone binding protein (JHBP).
MCLTLIPRLSLYLEELNITQMSEFNVNKIKMNWLRRKLEFEIRFPAIHIQTKYDMKGILGNVLPIHGNGPAS